MSRLHEVLAAEKTTVAAWNKLAAETLHKLKNPTDYLVGMSKSLEMVEDTPANKAMEAAASEEKAVTTTVFDTLQYAFEIFGKSEDLQFQKNATNRVATADVLWHGEVLLTAMPVDQLLGLEARLSKIREIFETMPTLAGSIEWRKAENQGRNIWEQVHPQVTTKTEKTVFPIVMSPATDKHPAQIQAGSKDVVVGKFRTVLRSGAATTTQKADALKLVDDLMIEVKKARMRANETEVVAGKISDKLIPLLMSPFA